MKGKLLILAALVVPIVMLSGCVAESEIDSFEDCIAAGYPALESYPRQCNTPDGKHFVEVLDEPIGGERDENGCLGPAGYSWNESVGSCIREWELDDDQKMAASLAVDFIEPLKGSTITNVSSLECDGCFEVQMILNLNAGDRRMEVMIENWEVTQSSVFCTEEEKQAEICTMEYMPVCGFMSDRTSETYGNACMACSNKIEYWQEGEC
ncbi:MAG: hypothetical protein JW700_03345 [Candidatus Aenigmarchaeota archaeon]|nr:hypothetical protein [Candidatus Aenigmarchaeota archaeon]